MINVDEVTASRLIFAPMGVFLNRCCGNATLKIGRGLSPMLDNVTARRTDIQLARPAPMMPAPYEPLPASLVTITSPHGKTTAAQALRGRGIGLMGSLFCLAFLDPSDPGHEVPVVATECTRRRC
jgi:hypothetical protein